MRLALISLTLLAVSACGWHLRGVAPLPVSVQSMTISSQAGERFTQRLRQQLTFNGVTFPDNASATVRLQVSPVRTERNSLSVNSSGQVAEYELNSKVAVQVTRLSDGVHTGWEISGRRVFTNDVNNVLATQNEEQIQRNELEDSLVRQLVRRLQKIKFPSVAADEAEN